MNIVGVINWVAWNVFLAVIPVVVGYSIAGLASVSKGRLSYKIPIYLLGIVWLAFLPNTCYLLTEWRHFFEGLDASNLYIRSRMNSDATLALMSYTVFFICYSGIGMLTFTLAIRPIVRILRSRGANLWVYGMLLFLLLSVGVYLGLILRYNSWDLVTRPGVVFNSIGSLAYRPRLAAFLVCFAAALWISYWAIDIWIDGLIARLKPRKAEKKAA